MSEFTPKTEGFEGTGLGADFNEAYAEPEYNPDLPAPEQVTDSNEKARVIADEMIERVEAILASLDPSGKQDLDKVIPKEKMGLIRKIVHDGMITKIKSEGDTYGEPEKINLTDAEEGIGVELPAEPVAGESVAAKAFG